MGRKNSTLMKKQQKKKECTGFNQLFAPMLYITIRQKMCNVIMGPVSE